MEHALGMNGETGRSKVAFFDSKPLWQSNNSLVSICFILQPHFCRSLQCFGAQGAILSYWRSSKLGKAKHAKSVNKAKFFATVQSPFVQGQPGSMWHWLAFDVLGHCRSKPPLHIGGFSMWLKDLFQLFNTLFRSRQGDILNVCQCVPSEAW